MTPGKVALAQPLRIDLRQDVMATLYQKGYPHHRMLEISIDQGIVLVSGVLPTYYLRQVALECIKRVEGVKGVVDRIQVLRELPDDAGLYFKAAELQPAIKQTGLEADACSTAGIPPTEVLPVQIQVGKGQAHHRIQEEGDSTARWFLSQIDIPAEEQLEAVCN